MNRKETNKQTNAAKHKSPYATIRIMVDRVWLERKLHLTRAVEKRRGRKLTLRRCDLQRIRKVKSSAWLKHKADTGCARPLALFLSNGAHKAERPVARRNGLESSVTEKSDGAASSDGTDSVWTPSSSM
ncbi:uncharacterized protein V6R79_012031 [Siganus canaliculatus]